MNSRQSAFQETESNVKLSRSEILSYGLSNFGYNIMYAWIYSFLTIYYTDIIGVAASSVSGLLLFVRFYDAVNDPLIGSWSDRTTGPFGKYKSWIIPGAVALGVSVFCLFSARPDWSVTSKNIWMYVFYILATTMATCVMVPNASLVGRMTTHPASRLKLASMRAMFIAVGANVVSLLSTPMLKFFSANGAPDAKGYSRTLGIFCVVGVAILLITTVRARIRVPDPKKQKQMSAAQQLQTFTKNRPLRIATYAFFVMGAVSYGRQAILLYYFTYTCQDAALMSMTGVIGMFTGILGSYLVPYLLRYVRHKGIATAAVLGICALFYGLSSFFDATQTVWWVFYALTAAITTGYNAVQYSILPDTIDYGEYVTGVRCDSFNSATVTFAMKVGGAVFPSLLLAALQAAGYVPNAVQTPQVTGLLGFFTNGLPALMMFLMAIIYLVGYKLSPEKVEEIQQALADRRREKA